MKKILTLILLFAASFTAFAQPQTEALRRQMRKEGATPHLLAEMARIFSTSQPDSALHYADRAARAKVRGADLITIEAARGEALVALGQTEKGLQHFKRAHDTAKKQKNIQEVYNQLCSMGICYSRLQRFEEASKCYEEVIEYGVKHNRQLAFSGYQNYAALCSRVGRTDDTKSMLLNALKYEDAAEPALRAQVYAGLGTICTYSPQTFTDAERYLRKGIEIAQKAHEPLSEACCLSPLITLLTQMPQRYDEIPPIIAHTDKIVKDLAPDGVERMQLEHAKVNFYFVTKQWAPALKSALTLYENGPAVSSERDKVLLMVARAYEGVGQADRACYFYREAYYVGDSIQQLNIQQTASDAAARYDAREKEFKIVSLEKDAAQAELKQWRLGVGLTSACLLLLIGGIGVMVWHRQQRRKTQLAEAKRYIDGVETERKRLAQELHDGVCNDLLVAEMQLSASADIEDATSQLHQVRNEIREISHELMPPNMQFATLDQMLSAMMFKLKEMGRFEVTQQIDSKADWSSLNPQKGHQLYRIVQEHVTNLIKHAHITRFSLDLKMKNSTVVLTLTDNGASASSVSSATAPSTTEGIGLQSTAERLKSIEARMECTTDSEGNRSVCITC